MSDLKLPQLEDIQAARKRIQDKVHLTPLLSSHALTERSGLENLWFKCETFQKTGSFKARGALNAIRSSLERDSTRRKFLTHSSGNHAQALAWAAKTCGASADIVIPNNAPKVKEAAIKGLGGVLHPCEPTLAARLETAKRVEAQFGPFTFIHPFDNPDVMAGQGTIMLEVVEQLKATGRNPPDAIVVPVGGGGMISGIAIAAKSLVPGIKVFGAEPLQADDARRSILQGAIAQHRPGCPNTMADGLLTTLAPRSFQAIQTYVDDIYTVSEDEMKVAMRLVMERAKLVIEPSAAVGVAVVLKANQLPALSQCKNVVVVLCGGNVQLDNLVQYLSPNPYAKL